MSRAGTLRALTALFATLLLAACANGDTDADGSSDDDGGEAAAGGSLTVGSANFDENAIVAAMYAEVLEDAGYDVERRLFLGTREVYLAALESGELDIVPEYVGSLVEFLEGGATSDADATVELAREQVPDGLVLLDPADAQNANGLVVLPETADELGLSVVSDLADVAGDLTLGGPPECPERPLCAPGYEEVYGITFGSFQPLEIGPTTFAALADGQIDVALMFTTDEVIAENGWVLLEEDDDLQPAENLTPLLRADAADDTVTELLNAVSAALTTEEITELNRLVRSEGQDVEDVAADWVREQGLID